MLILQPLLFTISTCHALELLAVVASRNNNIKFFKKAKIQNNIVIHAVIDDIFQ